MQKKRERVVLYVEVERALRDRLGRLAEVEGRSLTKEVVRAVVAHLDARERALGLALVK